MTGCSLCHDLEAICLSREIGDVPYCKRHCESVIGILWDWVPEGWPFLPRCRRRADGPRDNAPEILRRYPQLPERVLRNMLEEPASRYSVIPGTRRLASGA